LRECMYSVATKFRCHENDSGVASGARRCALPLVDAVEALPWMNGAPLSGTHNYARFAASAQAKEA
jgi:hypothetical protein